MGGDKPDTANAAPRPLRCASIDYFRGFVIGAMLLVNSIRGRAIAPESFHHADWRIGPLHATFADLVAPWFLFAVGLSVPFSMHGGRGRNTTLARKVFVAGRRMALLFVLGGLIEAARVAFHEPIRLTTLISLDVLPQIGVAYFVTIILYNGPRWARPAFILLVFLSKWILLSYWPYPGVGHHVWTPDQNIQDYLRAAYPMFKGFHGAMVAASIVCIGTYIGDRLRLAGPIRREALAFIAAGAAMVGVSWLWSFDLPFNRYYHTPTWALLAAGTGCAILGVFHLAWATSLGRRTLWVFDPPGRNPLTIYIVAELLWPLIDPLPKFKLEAPNSVYPWDRLEHALAPLVGLGAAPWMQVGLYLAAFWFLSWVMYRKRIAIRL